MKFTPAPDNINYPVWHHVSENDRWEIGLAPMLFGIRIRAGIQGNAWVEVDYCAGENEVMINTIFNLVKEILESLPEETDSKTVHQLFPSYERKPIFEDKKCWEGLIQLHQRQTKNLNKV